MHWRVGLGVIVCACGPVQGSPLGEPQDDGADDASSAVDGASSGTDGWADAGPDETSGASADDDATGAATTGDDGGLCGAAAPGEPIALLTRGDAASVVLADGTPIPLDVPQEPAEDAYVLGADARGDRIALAIGSSTLIDQTFHYHGSLSMFDTSGARSWTYAEAHGQLNGVYIGADGSVSATRSFERGPSDSVVVQDGVVTRSAQDFYVLGPPDAAGDVPGSLAFDGRPGWWRASDGAVVGVTHPLALGWSVRDPTTGSFVYYAVIEGIPAIVRESIDEIGTIPLPRLVGRSVQVERRSSSRWVLVVTLDDVGTPDGWARVDVENGAIDWLDTTLPGTWTRLECYGPSAALDHAGRLLQPARDASTAQVLRLDPQSGSWDPVGRLLTTVDAVDATPFGDAMLVRADGTGQTFCPPQTFDPAPDALAGSSMQLLRPDDLESLLVPVDRWPLVREDGRCAAFVGATTVTLLDLGASVQVDVSAADSGGGYNVSWWRD